LGRAGVDDGAAVIGAKAAWEGGKHKFGLPPFERAVDPMKHGLKVRIGYLELLQPLPKVDEFFLFLSF
jgi:hypothetical protein